MILTLISLLHYERLGNPSGEVLHTQQDVRKGIGIEVQIITIINTTAQSPIGKKRGIST